MKTKKAVVTPLTVPNSASRAGKKAGAISAPLIAGLFAEAGVQLRPGRADVISGSLGVAVTKFRTVAHRLTFEREPGLFPVMLEKTAKKGGRK